MAKPQDPIRARGSIGTSRVWDEETRKAHRNRKHAEPRSPAVPFAQGSAPTEDLLARAIVKALAGVVEKYLTGVAPERRSEIRAVLGSHILDLLVGEPAAAAPREQAAPARPTQPAAEPEPEPEQVEPEILAGDTPLLDHVDPELAADLRADLDRVGGDVRGMHAIREHAVALILDAVKDQRLKSGPASPLLPMGVVGGRMEILERRIAKLKRSLVATRQALQMLAELDDFHPGVKSIYKTVQGLAEDDSMFQTKQELLTDIFQANVTLQAELSQLNEQRAA